MVEDRKDVGALMLVHGHGYSYEEVAQALGETERQIEHRLVRGKNAVREKLGVRI